jgi:hypothetical protein
VSGVCPFGRNDGSGPEPVQTRQAALGTKFKIILYAASESTASTAAEAARRRVATLDGITSGGRPASELMPAPPKVRKSEKNGLVPSQRRGNDVWSQREAGQ